MQKLISQYSFFTLFVLIILLATFLRFYQLGSIPKGITWDEAAIGYNGYAVLTTRRDEWLQKLPISFRSFGDYKAPLAIYINGFSTAVFGMNGFGVRFPFAVAGVLFVSGIGLMSYRLFQYSVYRRWIVGTVLFLAAVSPWHLHYSRLGFESGLAVTMITWALVSFLYVEQALIERKNTKLQFVATTVMAILLIASLYTYHSAKITVPLLVIYLGVRFWKQITGKFILFAVVAGLSVALLYPLATDSLYGQGATRAGVLLTSQGLPVIELLQKVSLNFAKHFSPEFLIFGKTDSLRHGTGTWGVLSLSTFFLGIAGILSAVAKRTENSLKRSQVLYLAIILLVTGILPAALSSETVPHSNRALLALPGFLLVAAVGLEYFISKFAETNRLLIARVVLGSLLLLEGLQAVDFWQYLTTEFAPKSAAAFQEGYQEALRIAYDYELGRNGKPAVDTILISGEYGQPYIYVLFVRKTSPIAYQGGALNKYQFTDVLSPSDLERRKALIVATPKSTLPVEQANHVIKDGAGEIRFLLYYTGE